MKHRRCGDRDTNGTNCCRNVMLEPGCRLLQDWRFQCRLDKKKIGSTAPGDDWREHVCHAKEVEER